MQARFPRKGVSDINPAHKQDPDTTKGGRNVRVRDPVTGTMRGGQRSGQAKHSSTALAASTKVSHLCELVYDKPQNTYTALGDAATVEWSRSTPSVSDCYHGVIDRLGNRWALDGATGVVKLNADNQQILKISLPATEPGSVCRALFVDNALRIYVGVSEGGDVKKAKLWCYEQLEDNKTALLWELEPGYFTIALKVDGTTLYAAQNNPVTARARMALYTGIGVPKPTLSKEWTESFAYPVNDLDVSPKDGSIFTAHGDNTRRGLSPQSPDSTATAIDWTPNNLTNANLRLWHWTMADDVDGDGSMNSAHESGDVITRWVDRTQNGRDWTPRGSDTGPQLLKGRFAGRDTLFFNGTTCSMQSAAGLSVDRAYRQLNRTVLPCYDGAQFAVYMAFRTPAADSTPATSIGRRWVLSNHPDTTSANARVIFANTDADSDSDGIVAEVPLWGTIRLFEDTTNQPTANDRAQGINDTVLPGFFNQDGIVILAWIFDGGVDDTLSPTRSSFWINGRPIDRWHSWAGYANLLPTYLGWAQDSAGTPFWPATDHIARFLGDMLEIVVVSDATTTDYGLTSAETRLQLIEAPNWPDGNWAAVSNTEHEKFIGYLAHKWGAAHKLPSGQYNALACTANPALNETVTIGSTVYRFRTSGGNAMAQAYDVQVGADTFTTLRNLCMAINASGVAGTNYFAGTAAHPTFWCVGIAREGEALNPTLVIQSRSGYASAAATTETLAAGSWLAGNTTVTSRASSTNARGGYNTGHYPSSFYLYATSTSSGGPPRAGGGLGTSLPGRMVSPYGILAKWDPANGTLKNVATTVPGGSSIGGIGYGCRCNSAGDIYNQGPRVAADATIGVSADTTDACKIVDDPNGFITHAGGNNGTGVLNSWNAIHGAQTYQWPRMSVDRHDNVFMPIFQASNGTSMIAYTRLGSSGNPNAVSICTLTSLTDDPKAHAVAVDPHVTDFPAGFTNPRAERVTLFTRKEGSNTTVIYDLRLVSSALNTNAPRTIERLAVCGTSFFKVNKNAPATTISGPAFDSNARFFDSAALYGDLFLTDGSNMFVRRGKAQSFGYMRAEAGRLPPRVKFVQKFGKRLIFAGFADDRYAWACSAYGKPFNWDFEPQGDSDLTLAAIQSPLSKLGNFGDTPTCLAAKEDDLLVIAGEASIYVMTGDPGQGGKFDLVTGECGIAFGRARCFTPDGTFWFIDPHGEFRRMAIGEKPVLVSARIQKRLNDAIDFSVSRPELAYDPKTRCIHIFLVGLSTPSTLFTHWVLEMDTMELEPAAAFWPDTYGTSSVQPYSACVCIGDGAADRTFLLGSGDGYVRELSATADGDDGVRIDSFVDMHLPEADEASVEQMFEDFEIIIARDQGPARFEWFSSNEPDKLFTDPSIIGTLLPGRNRPADLRGSGAWNCLRIAGSMNVGRWAFERATLMSDIVAEQRA